jgi:hypothetical protein
MTTNSFIKRRSFGTAFLVALLLPDTVAAQGLPGESASAIPIWIWFIGTGILGLVLAYGIIHNRRRTRAETKVTDRAARELYAEEERQRVRSGAD